MPTTHITGFSSDLLVAEMSSRLNLQVQELPEGDPLRVAFPLVNPDGASVSYGLQALQYGARPGVETEVWVPAPGEKFELITDAAVLRERARQTQ